jgi:hypothetical protein
LPNQLPDKYNYLIMKSKVYFAIAFFIVHFNGITQVPFTAGNIVVYRVGTGSGTLNNNATAVFLDEYTITGTLVQSIALPTTTSGSNKALTATGRGDTEGLLTLSTDGQYLVLTGYNAPVGTTGIGGSSSASRPRTIGLVKYDATINTTTALTDLSSLGFVRSAVSTNGTDLWACGAGSLGTSGGVHYATVGASTSTQLTSPTTYTGQLRSLYIAGGQLYVSGNSNTPRIGTVGTGLPTTAGQTITNLPGLPVDVDPGQFVLLDLNAGVAGPDVLYFTEDNDGIVKYSLVSGSWVLNGAVGTSTDDYRGLGATISGTTVTLYSTRRGGNASNTKGGQLVSLTDASGHNGTFSATPVVLINAVTNAAAFRGVAAAPVPIILPVNLLSFTAGKTNQDVRLNWTATEVVNFSHFEVERSMDGMIFSVIGKVGLQQTGNGNTSYNYTDAGILNEGHSRLYYRLKMADIDGHVDYSKIVTVTADQNRVMLIKAYPDPFDNQIFIKAEIETAGKINLSLSDVWGRVVRSMNTFLPAGENTIYFSPPAQLPRGMYFLRVQINDKVTTLKLIK